MTSATPAGAPAARTSRSHSYHVEILLISFAALLLEISYTRIVSFKLYYYYTYLVIGLALLGLGTGGVLMAVSGPAPTGDDRCHPAVGARARRAERRRRIRRSWPGCRSGRWRSGTMAPAASTDQPRQADPALPGAVRVVHRSRRDARHAVRAAIRSDRPALLRRPPRCGSGVRRRRPADLVGRAPCDRVPRRRRSSASPACGSRFAAARGLAIPAAALTGLLGHRRARAWGPARHPRRRRQVRPRRGGDNEVEPGVPCRCRCPFFDTRQLLNHDGLPGSVILRGTATPPASTTSSSTRTLVRCRSTPWVSRPRA